MEDGRYGNSPVTYGDGCVGYENDGAEFDETKQGYLVMGKFMGDKISSAP